MTNPLDWWEGAEPVRPDQLLLALGDRASERKLRLFACALWRQNAASRLRRPEIDALDVAERYADGRASWKELSACRALALGVAAGTGRTAAIEALRAVLNRLQNGGTYSYSLDLEEVSRRYRTASARVTNPLLREIFGLPRQTVVLEPVWRSANDAAAFALARHIYAEGDFSRLPILADALEDAGCDNPVVLDHCRAADDHVRGCWVIDLILGYS